MQQEVPKSIKIFWKNLLIIGEIRTLKLKRNFNTAHSSSEERQNFFISIKWDNQIGMGECGLPPKLSKCYLTDSNDCMQFMMQLQNQLIEKNSINSHNQQQIQSLQQIILKEINTSQYFHLLTIPTTLQARTFIPLLYLCRKFKQKQFRAVQSCIQFAILDLWGIRVNMNVSQIIFKRINNNEIPIHKNTECYSFYTISYESNNQMLKNAQNALQYTNFLKIKSDNNIQKLMDLLFIMFKQSLGSTWIIDCNASWTMKEWIYFNSWIQQSEQLPLLNKIMYIEQPYQINLKQQQYEQWSKIKINCKIKIMADESFSNIKDVQYVQNIAHAVNIKMEKTAGPIEALKIMLKCQEQGLEIMMGSMLSTQLGCAQTYQFHQTVKYFDIDGSLLVDKPVFNKGFKFTKGGLLVGFDGPGLNICLQ